MDKEKPARDGWPPEFAGEENTRELAGCYVAGLFAWCPEVGHPLLSERVNGADTKFCCIGGDMSIWKAVCVYAVETRCTIRKRDSVNPPGYVLFNNW